MRRRGRLGYEPFVLTDRLCCEAREAGSFLASIARSHANDGQALAFLAGGETVVRLRGNGKGGRNQELALAAADGIRGLDNVAVFSVGSDGTDGPTDAAGGFVDGGTAGALERRGIRIHRVLEDNDAYHALEAVGGLIVTGPPAPTSTMFPWCSSGHNTAHSPNQAASGREHLSDAVSRCFHFLFMQKRRRRNTFRSFLCRLIVLIS